MRACCAITLVLYICPGSLTINGTCVVESYKKMPCVFSWCSPSPSPWSPTTITIELFAETDYPLHFGWAPLRSVRSEGFKFIEGGGRSLMPLITNKETTDRPAFRRDPFS